MYNFKKCYAWLGIGGSGRQSSSRLAAFMSDFELFQIEITKNYTISEWRDDLRRLMRRAGDEGTSMVFLFGDHQIKVIQPWYLIGKAVKHYIINWKGRCGFTCEGISFCGLSKILSFEDTSICGQFFYQEQWVTVSIFILQWTFNLGIKYRHQNLQELVLNENWWNHDRDTGNHLYVYDCDYWQGDIIFVCRMSPSWRTLTWFWTQETFLTCMIMKRDWRLLKRYNDLTCVLLQKDCINFTKNWTEFW